MLRLALISGSFQPDKCGVAHYTARLASELNTQGADVSVLTDAAGASGGVHPFDVRGITDEWSYAGTLRLVRSISRSKPDIVHLQHAPSSFGYRRTPLLLPLLLRLVGWRRAIVVTAHEYGLWDVKPKLVPRRLLETSGRYAERRGWWDRESLFLLTLSDAVIATNDLHHDAIRSKLPGLSPRLAKVPIGPNITVAQDDLSDIRGRVRSRLGLSPGEWMLVFFGFLHPVKGLETLFTAMEQLVATRVPLKLILMGGQESLSLQGEEARDYRRRLLDRSRELRIADHVVLTGYLPAPEVSQMLRAADLCVLPFNHGVTLKSGSLLAALAHGVPTLATRAETPDARLSHEQNVYFVPPKDSRAIADGILALTSSPRLRQALREGGLQLAKSFSWESIAREHLRIYDAVLSK